MSSATSEALGTVELLEQILLGLPLASILAANGVCRQWRSTIQHSLVLQRALFFVSIPHGPLRPLGPAGETPINHCDEDDLPRRLKPVLNPLLAQRFRLGRLDGPDADYDGGYLPMVSYRRVENEHLAELVGQGVEASWHRMFITQPPARRVEAIIWGNDMFVTRSDWVECEDGVTMGMIHDKVETMNGGNSWRKKNMGWYFEL